MAALLRRMGSRGFSSVSAGVINKALTSSKGLVDDVLGSNKTETDLLNAFARLKSGGRICASSDIKVIQIKEEAPKFLSVDDFNTWYEKVPSKVKKDVEAFLEDPRNSLYVVEDVQDSLLQNPVKTFCWEKPTGDFLKLNTDGSYKKLPDGSSTGGCAAVVRNCLGEIVSQDAWELPFATSGLDAEFIGVYLGVLQCKNLGLKKIVIESDCKELVQVLNSSRAPEEVELDSYRHLFRVLASLDDYRVQHQYREGNLVANQLASIARASCVDPTETHDDNFDLVVLYSEGDSRDTSRFRINQNWKTLKIAKNA